MLPRLRAIAGQPFLLSPPHTRQPSPSPLSSPHPLLRRPLRPRRWQASYFGRMAASRTVISKHYIPRSSSSLASKMKTINKSFYHLKDSYGLTQLLVHGPCTVALSQIPVESTVQIEGTVALRPVQAQKPVCHLPRPI